MFGVVAFAWPFFVAPGSSLGASSVAPVIFGALLLLVLAVVLAQLSEGGLDSKALALLGVLSALGAALRPLGAGTAGVETIFFLLIVSGRALGPGFGFSLGCTTLFASALITSGVGPWMPYQMFACAWIGLGAGLLPSASGRREIAMLAAYGAASAFFYGLVLNLSFWPFTLGADTSLSFVPGRAARGEPAPVSRVRRHDVARLGHRPRHHQRAAHRPRRPRRPQRAAPQRPQSQLRRAPRFS